MYSYSTDKKQRPTMWCGSLMVTVWIPCSKCSMDKGHRSAATHRASGTSSSCEHQRKPSWIIFQPASGNKEIQTKCPAATRAAVSQPGGFCYILILAPAWESDYCLSKQKENERADRDMEWRRLRQWKENNKHSALDENIVVLLPP